MECPICGSDDIEILNSKQKSSKKKIIEEKIANKMVFSKEMDYHFDEIPVINNKYDDVQSLTLCHI